MSRWSGYVRYTATTVTTAMAPPTYHPVEEEFAGFDFSFSAGLGVGFSITFWKDTGFASASFGWGLGFHVAALDSWTFELECTYGY
jgi:hypothetical protein